MIDKNLRENINKEFSKNTSFIVHDYKINKQFQKQDLILNVIKFLSRDLHYEKVIYQIDFLYFITSKIAKKKIFINFNKINFLLLRLIFKKKRPDINSQVIIQKILLRKYLAKTN